MYAWSTLLTFLSHDLVGLTITLFDVFSMNFVEVGEQVVNAL